jgi:putative hydrolase of the HAD superfamily
MASRFNYILLDLDSTLYSSRHGLEKIVNRRVNEFIAERLGLPLEEAWARRVEAIKQRGYGTTLEWLLAENQIADSEVEDYLRYIHPENEADNLPPDPELGAFLASLGVPLAIMTNSPDFHAERVLARLGLGDIFTSIFDIRFHGLKGKPRPEAFRRVFAALGTTAEKCLFVDDARQYVEGYRKLGGTGVFFVENGEHPEFPAPRIRSLRELKGMV